jgi:ribosomal subunit interface protein
MKINIQSHNLELTDVLREYAEKRIASAEKLLEKTQSDVLYEVELSKQTHHKKGDVFYAEVNLSVGGDLFRATAEGESVEATIDKVRDELVRELRKKKTKRINFLREGGSKVKAWFRGISG